MQETTHVKQGDFYPGLLISWVIYIQGITVIYIQGQLIDFMCKIFTSVFMS